MLQKKILIIFIFSFLIIMFVNVSNIYASTLGDVISGGKEFVNSSSGTQAIDTQKLKGASDSIYNTLLMISFIVVAIVGIVLGIKYMFAGVDEKADVKNSLLAFVIGTLVIYGSFGIWRVIIKFLNSSGL